MNDSTESVVSLGLMSVLQMRCNLIFAKILRDLAAGDPVLAEDIIALNDQLSEMGDLSAEILSELKALRNVR